MKRKHQRYAALLPALLLLLAIAVSPQFVYAHCDALDGPVVTDAREALSTGDVTVVLKWVDAADEAEVAAAFEQALSVRQHGEDARELADRYFFETLVRLHRKSEGAPYMGLQPAGIDYGPTITEAEEALKTGDVEHLIAYLTRSVTDVVRSSFEETVAAKEHAEESIEAGRAFVEAYVHFIHLVEGVEAISTHDRHPHEAAHVEH